MSGGNANKPKMNLASMAKKLIGEFSDIGNDVVDTFIQPFEESTDITVKDYPGNKYLPVISKRDNCRLVTLYIPGAGSDDIDIRREENKIDINGSSPETFPDETSEFRDWGNEGRMTYHFVINVPTGYLPETLKAQLRNGLLKIYFKVIDSVNEPVANSTVNIT